jgi:hypothetical protein
VEEDSHKSSKENQAATKRKLVNQEAILDVDLMVEVDLVENGEGKIFF